MRVLLMASHNNSHHNTVAGSQFRSYVLCAMCYVLCTNKTLNLAVCKEYWLFACLFLSDCWTLDPDVWMVGRWIQTSGWLDPDVWRDWWQMRGGKEKRDGEQGGEGNLDHHQPSQCLQYKQWKGVCKQVVFMVDRWIGLVYLWCQPSKR